MRKIIFLIVSLIFISLSFGHDQKVHVYFVREGYNLLKLWLGYDVPKLRDHINFEYIDSISGPWTTGMIDVGAWREDEEDPVYLYSKFHPPEITGVAGTIIKILSWFKVTPFDKDPFVSSTHFWEADNGDLLATDLEGTVMNIKWKFTVPNAYQKLLKYVDGIIRKFYLLKEEITPLRKIVGIEWIDTTAYYEKYILTFRCRGYSNLIDFYKTGRLQTHIIEEKIKVRFEKDITTGNFEETYAILDTSYITQIEPDTILPLSEAEKIVYEILGRMCHLLADVGVPAHAHRDAHGADDPGIKRDSFEEYEKLIWPNFYWDAQSVYNLYKKILYPYESSNPLHYLMYTTQQIADHFGSDGPYEGNGDDIIGGNPLPEEIKYLQEINLSKLGGPTTVYGPFDAANLSIILDKTFPQIIRATAGLLYWFAAEAGILIKYVLVDQKT
jgi:hypothetical protein